VVFDVLDRHPVFVNSIRSDGGFWYAPLHQAAYAVAQVPESVGLRAAVAAHLARYKGMSRTHTDADLPHVVHPTNMRIRSPPGVGTWSCTCGGCKRPASHSPPRCPGG
jgi:hypothetical protein